MKNTKRVVLDLGGPVLTVNRGRARRVLRQLVDQLDVRVVNKDAYGQGVVIFADWDRLGSGALLLAVDEHGNEVGRMPLRAFEEWGTKNLREQSDADLESDWALFHRLAETVKAILWHHETELDRRKATAPNP